jgi:hypothetical protein
MNDRIIDLGYVGHPRTSRKHSVKSIFRSPKYEIKRYVLRDSKGQSIEDAGSVFILEPSDKAINRDEICIKKQKKKCIVTKKTRLSQKSSKECASHPYFDIHTGRKHCEKRHVYTRSGLKTKIARIISELLKSVRKNELAAAREMEKAKKAIYKKIDAMLFSESDELIEDIHNVASTLAEQSKLKVMKRFSEELRMELPSLSKVK